jgi:hypothetical protein
VSLVYFTDRDLGRRFPAILAEAGLAVERHGELFKPDGSDEQWLEHCGTRSRVALSHNKRIRYVPNELDAVVRFKVRLIILIGQVPTSELARNFVRSVLRVEHFVSTYQPPFIAKLYRPTQSEQRQAPDAPGRIEPWYPR